MISSIEFSRGSGSGFEELIPAGVYTAKIEDVSECMMEPFQGKGDPKPGILFQYTVKAGGKKIEAAQEVAAALGNRAILRKMLDNLKPKELTEDVLASDDAVVKLINSLKGQVVQLVVIIKTSGSGKQYNKIDNVLPANADTSNIELPEEEEDDIPF